MPPQNLDISLGISTITCHRKSLKIISSFLPDPCFFLLDFLLTLRPINVINSFHLLFPLFLFRKVEIDLMGLESQRHKNYHDIMSIPGDTQTLNESPCTHQERRKKLSFFVGLKLFIGKISVPGSIRVQPGQTQKSTGNGHLAAQFGRPN